MDPLGVPTWPGTSATWPLYLPLPTQVCRGCCDTRTVEALAALMSRVAALEATQEPPATSTSAEVPREFREGDMVRYCGTAASQLLSRVGVIRVLAPPLQFGVESVGSPTRLGVEWVGLTTGHTLDGRCRRGRSGWWVSCSDVVLA